MWVGGWVGGSAGAGQGPEQPPPPPPGVTRQSPSRLFRLMRPRNPPPPPPRSVLTQQTKAPYIDVWCRLFLCAVA